jgi:hypothetical protein
MKKFTFLLVKELSARCFLCQITTDIGISYVSSLFIPNLGVQTNLSSHMPKLNEISGIGRRKVV